MSSWGLRLFRQSMMKTESLAQRTDRDKAGARVWTGFHKSKTDGLYTFGVLLSAPVISIIMVLPLKQSGNEEKQEELKRLLREEVLLRYYTFKEAENRVNNLMDETGSLNWKPLIPRPTDEERQKAAKTLYYQSISKRVDFYENFDTTV